MNECIDSLEKNSNSSLLGMGSALKWHSFELM